MVLTFYSFLNRCFHTMKLCLFQEFGESGIWRNKTNQEHGYHSILQDFRFNYRKFQGHMSLISVDTAPEVYLMSSSMSFNDLITFNYIQISYFYCHVVLCWRPPFDPSASFIHIQEIG